MSNAAAAYVVIKNLRRGRNDESGGCLDWIIGFILGLVLIGIGLWVSYLFIG